MLETGKREKFNTEISDQIKKVIIDLDRYMTSYEKSDYLRSLLGPRTRINYLSLSQEWRNLWDSFYGTTEFTRHFVDTLITDYIDNVTGSLFAHTLYLKIAKKLEDFEIAEWENQNILLNARLRDEQFLHTGR